MYERVWRRLPSAEGWHQLTSPTSLIFVWHAMVVIRARGVISKWGSISFWAKQARFFARSAIMHRSWGLSDHVTNIWQAFQFCQLPVPDNFKFVLWINECFLFDRYSIGALYTNIQGVILGVVHEGALFQNKEWKLFASDKEPNIEYLHFQFIGQSGRIVHL